MEKREIKLKNRISSHSKFLKAKFKEAFKCYEGLWGYLIYHVVMFFVYFLQYLGY